MGNCCGKWCGTPQTQSQQTQMQPEMQSQETQMQPETQTQPTQTPQTHTQQTQTNWTQTPQTQTQQTQIQPETQTQQTQTRQTHTQQTQTNWTQTPQTQTQQTQTPQTHTQHAQTNWTQTLQTQTQQTQMQPETQTQQTQMQPETQTQQTQMQPKTQTQPTQTKQTHTQQTQTHWTQTLQTQTQQTQMQPETQTQQTQMQPETQTQQTQMQINPRQTDIVDAAPNHYDNRSAMDKVIDKTELFKNKGLPDSLLLDELIAMERKARDIAPPEKLAEALEGITKIIELKLNQFYKNQFKGKLFQIGSSVDGTKTGKSDEFDYLYVVNRDSMGMKNIGDKGYKLFYKAKEVKASEVAEVFMNHIDEIAAELDLTNLCLQHGGFASPSYSGCRRNGPAATLLFMRDDDTLISLDFTIAFLLSPEEEKRILSTIAGKVDPLFKGKNEDETAEFLKDTLCLVAVEPNKDVWRVSTARLEAVFLHELPQDHCLKIAMRYGKILSKEQISTIPEKHVFFDEGPQNVVTENLEKYRVNPKIHLQELNKKMRLTHYYLTPKKGQEYNELTASIVKLDSACIKHTALRVVCEGKSKLAINGYGEELAKVIITEILKGLANQSIYKVENYLYSHKIKMVGVAMYAARMWEVLTGYAKDRCGQFLVCNGLAHKTDLTQDRGIPDAYIAGRDSNTSDTVISQTTTGLEISQYSGVDEQERHKSLVEATENTKIPKDLPEAASAGDVNRALELLLQGADVNDWNDDGLTALSLAAMNGNLKMMKLLFLQGAKLDEGKRKPLHAAAGEGSLQSVQWLLNNGADVNGLSTYSSGYDYTALWGAAQSGHLEMMKLLFSQGADTELGDWKPLYGAALKGHLQCVQWLLQNGADVNGLSAGKTALYEAACSGHLEVIKLLFSQGADLDLGYLKPLHGAAREGHLQCVQWLLQNGADVNELISTSVIGGGNTALYVAAESGHLEMMKLLFSQGADLELGWMWKPLHGAAREGHLQCVQWLLQNGADVNGLGANSSTALCVAARSGHLEVIKLLFSQGADLQLGVKPLHGAAREGHFQCVQWLLQNGADVNGLTSRGYTALSEAAGSGHLEVMELLFTQGADLELGDWKPLYGAAAQGHLQCVQWLLKNGASQEVKDEALRVALRKVQNVPEDWSDQRKADLKQIVEVLTSHGAVE